MQREEAHRRAYQRKHFNKFDGLIHNPDGSTSFIEGAPVNGVNTYGYVQLSGTDYGTGKDSYDYLYEDHIEKVRAQNAIDQKEADKKKKVTEWNSLYNEFDGLVHKDGKLYDFTTHKEV